MFEQLLSYYQHLKVAKLFLGVFSQHRFFRRFAYNFLNAATNYTRQANHHENIHNTHTHCNAYLPLLMRNMSNNSRVHLNGHNVNIPRLQLLPTPLQRLQQITVVNITKTKN